MENNYLPKQATISEACEWLQDETGEHWTLVRLIEHGLMPWFWLDYQAGWPDAVFNGCHEGYLAPLCFGGDTQRLAAGVSDVLVTMSRTQSGELFKLEVSPNAVSFPIDDLRFLRDDITQLAGKLSKPANAPAAKVQAGAITSPSDDWKDKARAIADECFDHDTKMNCRDSLKNYSNRVMVMMQERGIKGPRGIIDNANYVMREALQSDDWWKKKSK